MFRTLRRERLWNTLGAVIRPEAKPSERNAEGYPRASRTLIELPARGDLPPVKLTLYAREKPAEDLMLGWLMAGWSDLLVGTQGSLYSECPWNTR